MVKQVSVPLRGVSDETLRDNIKARRLCNQVSVPLRGVSDETLFGCLICTSHKVGMFPSPCGELVMKPEESEALLAELKKVSVPLRGVSYETHASVHK